MTTTVGYGHQNWEKMRLFSAAFFGLGKKGIQSKTKFLQFGCGSSFCEFLSTTNIVNTNKKKSINTTDQYTFF